MCVNIRDKNELEKTRQGFISTIPKTCEPSQTKSWRIGRINENLWHQITWIPYHLIFSGDAGDLIIEHRYELANFNEKTVEWVASSSFGYLLSKCVLREKSEPNFDRTAQKMFAQAMENGHELNLCDNCPHDKRTHCVNCIIDEFEDGKHPSELWEETDWEYDTPPSVVHGIIAIQEWAKWWLSNMESTPEIQKKSAI
jgi:hypothetical protein